MNIWKELIRNFISKTVSFKFRGIDFTFDLSQGLFSSADVDSGTKFLLKILSQTVDDDVAAGNPLPRRVLDAGCGTGVIGICAATAIAPLVADGGFLVHCQDRDELARLFTMHNAARNNIPPAVLEAYTEPLLAGPGDQSLGAYWDLILTNIPAKAGAPVLEDFVRRSAGLLKPGGKVIMVAVHTLAGFFRERIAADAELLSEHKSAGHSVFVYGRAANQPSAVAVNGGAGFIAQHPFYVRTAVTHVIEEIPVHLTTIHGASGFDQPGGAVLAAAKLARKLGAEQFPVDAPLLVHEPDQGFFPCWLISFTKYLSQRHKGTKEEKRKERKEIKEGLAYNTSPPLNPFVPLCLREMSSLVTLSGRNILALEAARYNVIKNSDIAATIIPAANLPAPNEQAYGCIAAFPELLPQSSLPKGTDQLAAIWDAVPPLLAGGGIFLVTFSSSDAERFDRKKPAGFSRLGSVKRNGFRALAYGTQIISG